jgi:hypothetical protein
MALNPFKILFTCSCVLGSLKLVAQDSSHAHIDPSKPTNVYNRLSNNIEYNFLKNGRRTYGYRANLVLATPRQHHSVHIELPLLYSTFSKKFGLGDIRLRYYWVPYRNYSKEPGAFGFLIDTYLPTGNFYDGLGRGRWIIAPGLSTAFVFGRFSTFPIISYLYSGEIMSSKISPAAREALNGYMIQSICVYKFKKSYVDCTPIFMKNSYSNGGKDDFVLESNYLYMVKPNKMQIGSFVRRYFYGNSTTIRLAMRVYF